MPGAGEASGDSTVPNLLFSGSTQSSFACHACKRKKIKCDRVAPQCNNCEKADRSCEYPLSVPKPGPKAGFTSRKRRREGTDGNGQDEHDDGAVEGRTGSSSGNGRKGGGEHRLESSGRGGERSGTDENGDLNDSIVDIVHPQHQERNSESWDQGGQSLPGGTSHCTSGHGSALAQALKNMAITSADCQGYINNYFDNMTSFSLFHRPSFERKLASISSPNEIEALLTTMIAFAKPFGEVGGPSALRNLPAWCIWDRSVELARDCLEKYTDETPPLHIVQALLISTWNQLYQGVRSSGWRAVGECVRICYEMRLHQEDAVKSSPRSWIEREERRRAWYVAWELDVFASTIKRLPTAISWSTNKVKLPVEDSNWFSGSAGESCLFNMESSERWKDLERSGNTSGQAWFIVLNSYKYEAYLLSTNPKSSSLRYAKDERATPDTIRKHRDMLINCVHCTQLALPEKLALRDRFLSFRSADRIDDAWRYSIHQMLQVAKFLLYRLDIFFRPQPPFSSSSSSSTSSTTKNRRKQHHPHPSSEKASSSDNTSKPPSKSTDTGPSQLVWEQLLASGSESVRVLRNSTPEHIKWINPCVANAIWFGAAALTVGLVLGPIGMDRSLLVTNFDLLRATIKEYVRVSRVPDTLVSSLDTLEENLRVLHDKSSSSNGSGGGGGTAGNSSTLASASGRGGGLARGPSVAPSEATTKSPMSSVDPDYGSKTMLTPNSERLPDPNSPAMATLAIGNYMPPPLGAGQFGATAEKELGDTMDFDLGYFDAPGLDMTQTFADMEALWATTADWGFNIDCFRCPYE